MKNVSRIIDDYRKGDFEARLNLFLECREFRREFVEIEQREAATQKNNATNPDSIYKVKSRFFCFPVHQYFKTVRHHIAGWWML